MSVGTSRPSGSCTSRMASRGTPRRSEFVMRDRGADTVRREAETSAPGSRPSSTKAGKTVFWNTGWPGSTLIRNWKSAPTDANAGVGTKTPAMSPVSLVGKSTTVSPSSIPLRHTVYPMAFILTTVGPHAQLWSCREWARCFRERRLLPSVASLRDEIGVKRQWHPILCVGWAGRLPCEGQHPLRPARQQELEEGCLPSWLLLPHIGDVFHSVPSRGTPRPWLARHRMPRGPSPA
jgi:hypothetical protein